MKPVAYIAASVALLAAASAQQADPALDDLNRPAGEGPSELDILSQGSDTDFPDIDKITERKPVSVTLRALNKVTAKYTDIVVNMNEPAKYGSLELTPRFCDKRPPEEFPETTAFLEIVDLGVARDSDYKPGAHASDEAADETAAAIEGVTDEESPALPDNMIFSGWMFASSPALNGLEHPVYDVWVIDCKTVSVDN